MKIKSAILTFTTFGFQFLFLEYIYFALEFLYNTNNDFNVTIQYSMQLQYVWRDTFSKDYDTSPREWDFHDIKYISCLNLWKKRSRWPHESCFEDHSCKVSANLNWHFHIARPWFKWRTTLHKNLIYTPVSRTHMVVGPSLLWKISLPLNAGQKGNCSKECAILCRHLIPAPVDRTSASAWLYK